MQRQDIQPGAIVRLTWLDSKTLAGWVPNDARQIGVATLRSVGYVVVNSEKAMTITTSRCEELETSTDPISVPWGAITAIQVIP